MKKLIAVITLGMLALPAFCATQELPAKQDTKQTTTTKKKRVPKKKKEPKQETPAPAPK